MKKYYIDGPMGQVHVREFGDHQAPPIVLLHQTAWSSLQFKNAMPYLVEHGLRCIAVDTPGFGMSDGPDTPPTVQDYAESLAVTLDALNIEQTIMLGHHTGASIATAYAINHPDKLVKLLLHGVPIYSEEARAERLAKPHFDQTPREDGSHLTDRWALANSVSGGSATPEAIHWSLVQFFWAGPKEWFGHHAAFKYDMEKDYQSLEVPTVILSNSGDVLHKKMPYLRELRPDFRYTEIEGGTFHIIFEEAERWSHWVAKHALEGNV
ncbi:MAG: alpha/beta fold hydrolase [Rhodospirillaceae bacterium]